MSDSTLSSPHVIRLRGPWQLQPLWRWAVAEDGAAVKNRDALPPSGRIQAPADWSGVLGRDFCGQARHQRFFHRPTGIDAGERVWLVCDGALDSAIVTLNGRQLGEFTGPAAGARFDVTQQLAPRNELLIDVTFAVTAEPGTPAVDRCGGLTGEVRLEIFPPAARS